MCGRDMETCEQNPKHTASELTRLQIRLFPDKQSLLSSWNIGGTVLYCFSYEINTLLFLYLCFNQISLCQCEAHLWFLS